VAAPRPRCPTLADAFLDALAASWRRPVSAVPGGGVFSSVEAVVGVGAEERRASGVSRETRRHAAVWAAVSPQGPVRARPSRAPPGSRRRFPSYGAIGHCSRPLRVGKGTGASGDSGSARRVPKPWTSHSGTATGPRGRRVDDPVACPMHALHRRVRRFWIACEPGQARRRASPDRLFRIVCRPILARLFRGRPTFPAGTSPSQPQDRPKWVPYSPQSALQ
jgi:hypothetical protein